MGTNIHRASAPTVGSNLERTPNVTPNFDTSAKKAVNSSEAKSLLLSHMPCQRPFRRTLVSCILQAGGACERCDWKLPVRGWIYTASFDAIVGALTMCTPEASQRKSPIARARAALRVVALGNLGEVDNRGRFFRASSSSSASPPPPAHDELMQRQADLKCSLCSSLASIF